MSNQGEKIVDRIVKDKKRRRAAAIILILLVAVLGLIFVISAFAENVGNYTINLNYKDHATGLSLYANRDFSEPTTRLEAKSLEKLTNITYADIGKDSMGKKILAGEVDGSYNAIDSSGDQKFFGYTFYVKNDYDKVQYYTGGINLIDVAKNVDAAVRFLLIQDTTYYGDPDNKRDKLIYAKPATGGGKEEDADRNFENSIGRIVPITDEASSLGGDYTEANKFRTIEPTQIHQYTFIMYLEGNDPECIENIKGGMLKFNFDFTVHQSIESIEDSYKNTITKQEYPYKE